MILDKSGFWQWGYSNILDNTIRGVVAEYIVAHALGVTQKPRSEWNSWDLETKTGRKIEVKSSAYLQSWKQDQDSVISFKIAKKYGWDPSSGDFDKIQQRHADIYIFCLFKEKNCKKANPLNTSQWDFYVIHTELLEAELGEQKSVGISTLELITSPITYGQLRHDIMGY